MCFVGFCDIFVWFALMESIEVNKGAAGHSDAHRNKYRQSNSWPLRAILTTMQAHAGAGFPFEITSVFKDFANSLHSIWGTGWPFTTCLPSKPANTLLCFVELTRSERTWNKQCLTSVRSSMQHKHCVLLDIVKWEIIQNKTNK